MFCNLQFISKRKHITNYYKPNKMIVNISEPFKNKHYSFRPPQTPKKESKKDPTSTRSHKSFVKDPHFKVSMMLEMNKKYEHDLINSEFYKLRDLQKYSPKKITQLQKEKSFQNLSPIKIHKASNSKQKSINKKINSQSFSKLLKDQNFTLFGQKFTQKKIIQNESNLPEVPSNQVYISNRVEDSTYRNPNAPLTGFWTTQNKLVSLFPVNNRKIDKVPVINQPYILPMLGCLTVKKNQNKTEKYIVTELYQNNSLRDVLNEFQNLDQSTVKSYLRKIILCVWNLHKNRIAHNRLNLDAFISNQSGDLFLNMLKSTTKPLTQRQRFEQTYNFPPQMLLSRTNYDSTKNDIWSIGCIALELLTNYEHKNNPYHPYNQSLDQEENVDSPTKLSTVQIPRKDKNYRFLTSFQVSRMSSQFNIMKDSSSILQKVRRLIQSDSSPTIINQSFICIDLCESIILKEISPLAADFAKRCLNVKLQKRPSIDELMFHPFLK